MDIQDVIFILVAIGLLIKRRTEWFVWSGIACLLLSVPLFYFLIHLHIAQRLTYYAAAFFLVAILLSIFQAMKK